MNHSFTGDTDFLGGSQSLLGSKNFFQLFNKISIFMESHTAYQCPQHTATNPYYRREGPSPYPFNTLLPSASRSLKWYFFFRNNTGILISPQPDQEGNKLQRQKILMFIYPIYNHNWRNNSTIYLYITRLALKELFSPTKKIHWEVDRTKDFSAPRYMQSSSVHIYAT